MDSQILQIRVLQGKSTTSTDAMDVGVEKLLALKVLASQSSVFDTVELNERLQTRCLGENDNLIDIAVLAESRLNSIDSDEAWLSVVEGRKDDVIGLLVFLCRAQDKKKSQQRSGETARQ